MAQAYKNAILIVKVILNITISFYSPFFNCIQCLSCDLIVVSLFIGKLTDNLLLKGITWCNIYLGIKIKYAEQEYPRGLPEAFIIGEKFIGKSSVALILGDNFFYGQSLTEKLQKCTKLKKGAKVFLYPVNNPSQYGIAEIKNNKIKKIVEKPKKPFSNLAITGLYFFDNSVVKFAKQLKPSRRGELEIVDLINKYKKNKRYTNYC